MWLMNFCSEVRDGQSNGRRSPSISALFPFLSRAKDAEPLSRSLLVWWCCKNELVKGSSRHMPLPSRFSKSCCFIKKRGHRPPRFVATTTTTFWRCDLLLIQDPLTWTGIESATCFQEPTDCSREPTEFCYSQCGWCWTSSSCSFPSTFVSHGRASYRRRS